MIQGVYSADSALRAYSTAQSVTANNIANINTPAYKSARVSILDNMGGGVHAASVSYNGNQGYLINTGRPLDFAIEGDGYFAVRTDDGIQMTRQGSFSVSAEGDIVDRSGNIVAEGTNIQPGEDVNIDNEGNILVNGEQRGALEIVNQDRVPEDGRTYDIRQGFLEASNVEVAREMVDSMLNMRAFEANILTRRTYDDMLGLIVNLTG